MTLAGFNSPQLQKKKSSSVWLGRHFWQPWPSDMTLHLRMDIFIGGTLDVKDCFDTSCCNRWCKQGARGFYGYGCQGIRWIIFSVIFLRRAGCAAHDGLLLFSELLFTVLFSFNMRSLWPGRHGANGRAKKQVWFRLSLQTCESSLESYQSSFSSKPWSFPNPELLLLSHACQHN